MNEELQPLLVAEQLTRRFGTFTACNAIDLALYPGEVLGIVGESGSGKSTLLKCLSGQSEPDSGHVLFNTRHEGIVDLYAISATACVAMYRLAQMSANG
jgi:putative phosphonate transport system ATP-binding protein